MMIVNITNICFSYQFISKNEIKDFPYDNILWIHICRYLIQIHNILIIINKHGVYIIPVSFMNRPKLLNKSQNTETVISFIGPSHYHVKLLKQMQSVANNCYITVN